MHEYQEYNCQIIFTRYLQEVLDHFAACFGIRIAFFNTMGQEMKVGMRQDICGFCKLVRNRMNLLNECLESDHKHMDEALRSGCSVSYHCHAGLCEIIKPVYLDGLFIGYIMIGQFRDRELPGAGIRSQWLRQFKDDGELSAAYQNIPCFHPSMIDHIKGIFEVLVESTVDKHAYRLEDEEPMFKVKNYLFRNIARNVTLQEVAAYLNWSKSKLSHTLKNKIGRSFKQLQLEMKLSFAEQLIIERGQGVAEAANAAGFADPCYFSRIYKKYRGVSPVVFKKSSRDRV